MVTRRDVLKTLGTTCLAAAVRPGRGQAQQSRPNILWISCEDISPHLGCYGDPNAITPTLDQLAEEGARYTNAFTVAGVCAPSRSGIITGMYPSTLGSQYMRCQATLPEHVKCFTEYLRAAGYYCTNNSKTDYNFKHPPSAWDESSRKAHWRKRPEGRPFFAVFNFTITHESQVRLRGDAFAKRTQRLQPTERQDPAKLSLPPYYPDTPETRRDWAQYYELITAMDYLARDVLQELEEDGLSDDTIVFYWSDHGVGLPRAKRWLYDSGTHVPLIVRIPEKFRVDGQGQPGTVNDELVSFIDLAPTVLNLAGVAIPDHLQGRPFLGPNLPPPREYVYGARDRMDERYDIIRTVRDKRYRYIRNYEPFKPYYQYISYAEVGPTMKELRRLHAAGQLAPEAEQFMADHKPIEELYDLENDRHEVRNLADSAQHQDVLQRLRDAHVKWMLETRDLGLVPEAEVAEREKQYGSRYAILRQPELQDLLPRLRSMVELGERGKAARRKLLAALDDPDPAIRYWAVTGLGNLGQNPARALDRLKQALTDEAAIVRVAAARALCNMGLDDQGVPVLINELKGPNDWARLAAVDVLDNLGERGRPALEVLRQDAKNDKNRYVVRVVEHALRVLEGGEGGDR
ncbi:MAG: sulfatase-like hydrolase/transferase [Armatimonadota bacterium]